MATTGFNVFIPNIDFSSVEKKKLFLMVRPFFSKSSWHNDETQKNQWGLTNTINYTPNVAEASIALLPMPVNLYAKSELKEFNELCFKNNIFGFAYILGDLGKKYPHFDNLIYFRNGGFKNQLTKNNIGFPTLLPDALKNIYQRENIEERSKSAMPTISFCGHADNSISKKWKDYLMFAKKNAKRFFENPFTTNYEPFFASAFERYTLLNSLETEKNKIATKFKYKKKYLGGRNEAIDKKAFLREYYDSILYSDYVLCLRGAGNFSVRFYETLMIGRIPVLIDTDCLLPFQDVIDWEKHVVRIPWNYRRQTADILSKFHQNLSDKEFRSIQNSNRELWEESLSLAGMFNILVKLPSSKKV